MPLRQILLWSLFFSALLLGVFSFLSAKKSAESRGVSAQAGEVQIRPCDFASSYGQRVECYWVPVEDASARARLAVAIFRAPEASAADPLVYIAGGPGETGNTASESLGVWDEWLSRMPIGRDFVLLDVRGASPSEPAWDCSAYTQRSRDLLNRDLTFVEEAEIIAPVLEKCLLQWQDNLRAQGGPVTRLDEFSSLLNAHDLGVALRKLGYQQWNYLAVSYGTRVALLAAMLQPEVRRLVLDSPYPLDRGSLADGVTLWAEAFAEFWRRCERSSCPFDEARFWALMAQLRQQPVSVEVENWRSGRREKWLLNDGRLAAAIYTAFYSSEMTGRLAPALDDYTRGDSAELTLILEVFFNQVFDSRFNSAIYWATECNDNLLDDEVSFAQALATTGPWRPYFSGDWQYSICRSPAFRSAQLPPMRPVSTPVLVGVGALDPITTEAHARALMSSLSAGYLLVQEHHSHAEFFMGECGQHLIPWFLQVTQEQLAAQWQEKLALCRSTEVGPTHE